MCKVAREGCQKIIVKKFQQQSETNSNQPYIMPYNTTDRPKNFIREDVGLDCKAHEKSERVEFMRSVIEVAHDWRWVNCTNIYTTWFQLNSNTCCERTKIRLRSSIKGTERSGLTSSSRGCKNHAAPFFFVSMRVTNKWVICIADVALHSWLSNNFESALKEERGKKTLREKQHREEELTAYRKIRWAWTLHC